MIIQRRVAVYAIVYIIKVYDLGMNYDIVHPSYGQERQILNNIVVKAESLLRHYDLMIVYLFLPYEREDQLGN